MGNDSGDRRKAGRAADQEEESGQEKRKVVFKKTTASAKDGPREKAGQARVKRGGKFEPRPRGAKPLSAAEQKQLAGQSAQQIVVTLDTSAQALVSEKAAMNSVEQQMIQAPLERILGRMEPARLEKVVRNVDPVVLAVALLGYGLRVLRVAQEEARQSQPDGEPPASGSSPPQGRGGGAPPRRPRPPGRPPSGNGTPVLAEQAPPFEEIAAQMESGEIE